MKVHHNVHLLLGSGEPYKVMTEFHKGNKVVSLLNDKAVDLDQDEDTVPLVYFPDPGSHHLSIACFLVTDDWQPNFRNDEVDNITHKVLGDGEDACDGSSFKGGYEVHKFTEERFLKALKWVLE